MSICYLCLYSFLTDYVQYLKLKKPTGSGVCPPEVKCAHELGALINDRAGTRDVSDSEFNDIVSDEESSDDVEVVDDAPATVHTAVARRAPTPLARPRSMSAPDLANRLSRAFDPQTLRARDERFNCAEQNTQVFLLSQQLWDAHSVSDSIRNQLSILQQQLHDAERL